MEGYDDTVDCYAVLDGHGGSQCVNFVAQWLVEGLRVASEQKKDDNGKPSHRNLSNILADAFCKIDGWYLATKETLLSRIISKLYRWKSPPCTYFWSMCHCCRCP